jgi:hypothetical protein
MHLQRVNSCLTSTVYSYTLGIKKKRHPAVQQTPTGRLTPRLHYQTLGLRESISPGPALAGSRLVERPRKPGPFSFAAPQLSQEGL